jgi:hypothetical protein
LKFSPQYVYDRKSRCGSFALHLNFPEKFRGKEKEVFPIVETRLLAAAVKQFKIAAPEIASKRKPGQFVVLRINEEGERIPLTIADADPRAGIITLIFQEVGTSTAKLGKLKAGDWGSPPMSRNSEP